MLSWVCLTQPTLYLRMGGSEEQECLLMPGVCREIYTYYQVFTAVLGDKYYYINLLCKKTELRDLARATQLGNGGGRFSVFVVCVLNRRLSPCKDAECADLGSCYTGGDAVFSSLSFPMISVKNEKGG